MSNRVLVCSVCGRASNDGITLFRVDASNEWLCGSDLKAAELMTAETEEPRVKTVVNKMIGTR